MRLFELFEKSKSDSNTLSIPVEKPRDPHAASLARKSGDGRHRPKDAQNIKSGKFRKLKHRNKELDEDQ